MEQVHVNVHIILIQSGTKCVQLLITKDILLSFTQSVKVYYTVHAHCCCSGGVKRLHILRVKDFIIMATGISLRMSRFRTKSDISLEVDRCQPHVLLRDLPVYVQSLQTKEHNIFLFHLAFE